MKKKTPKRIHIIGSVGSGKTTLAKQILRLEKSNYKPTLEIFFKCLNGTDILKK